MANEIQITKDFPPSRERAVLLELLAVTQALKKEGIDAVVCGGWVLFLKELARDSQTSHSLSFDIDVLLRAKAREPESVDRIKVCPKLVGCGGPAVNDVSSSARELFQ